MVRDAPAKACSYLPIVGGLRRRSCRLLPPHVPGFTLQVGYGGEHMLQNTLSTVQLSLSEFLRLPSSSSSAASTESQKLVVNAAEVEYAFTYAGDVFSGMRSLTARAAAVL